MLRDTSFTLVAALVCNHEVNQMVVHELKSLFFTYFLAKFTLLGA